MIVTLLMLHGVYCVCMVYADDVSRFIDIVQAAIEADEVKAHPAFKVRP